MSRAKASRNQSRRAKRHGQAQQVGRAQQGGRVRHAPTPDVSRILATARAHFARGERAEVEAILRQALDDHPCHAEAYNQLGAMAHEAGYRDLAVEYARRAISADSEVAEYHSNLGYLLWERGEYVAAVESCRRAVGLDPSYFPGHNHLGLALQATGDVDGAIDSFHKVLTLQPEYAPAHSNLGLALQARKDLSGAVDCFEAALALAPDFADAHHHLAVALHKLSDTEAAMEQYRQALALQPTNAQFHNNLGSAFLLRGEPTAAIAQYREALRLNPAYADAFNNLGNALRETGDLDGAIDCFHQAMRIDPIHVGAHNNLALVLDSIGDLRGAIAHFREELRLRPDSVPAMANMLRPLGQAGEWSEVETLGGRLRQVLHSEAPEAFPPFSIVTVPSTAEEQLTCARTWVSHRFKSAERLRPSLGFRLEPLAKPRLRLGYISSDFREHAVGRLVVDLMENHDRERFEIVGYSIGLDDGSELGVRIRRAFDSFVDLNSISSIEAAQRIHADGIDILVDLNGHTKGSRTEILALRPAAVQVNFLGYPGTMGASFIDYVITDRFLTPPDQQDYYHETFMYLPDVYQPNGARTVSETVLGRSQCGLPAHGFIFCSFNDPYKITREVFEVWMRILRGTPGSVLWLQVRNDLIAGNLQREARERGIDPQRLIFAARRPMPEYLALYRMADLFLDTWPYNAGVTASDALWMGLPLLTKAGATYASRMAGSLLHAAGLPELVTFSTEQYEAEALRLAHDGESLDALGAKVKGARDTSPLFDTRRYTRNLERACEEMWRNAVAG